MNTKLQELTDKIYQEGIEKAQLESEQIIQNAKQEANQIIQSAKQERDKLIRSGEDEINIFKKNVTSELMLASKQMVAQLKLDVEHLVQGSLVKDPVSEALSNQEFIEKSILEVASTLQSNSLGEITVQLSEKQHQNLSDQFKKQLEKSFNGGVTFTSNPTLKTGFKIGPSEGNYLVSFTQEDFNILFGKYLRKETLSFLQKASE